MTDAERIIREKAVWLVVGSIADIVGAKLPESLFIHRGKILCAIMPIEEEATGREG
jgi:hypothetical protein